MAKVKQSVIKEIAREIGKGNTCYLLRNTETVITIQDALDDPKLKNIQDQQLEKIQRKAERYVKVEPLSIEDQLIIMNDFPEELPNKSVRKQLENALKRKNPIRNFHAVMEMDMELQQHWRNFNSQEYQRWVSNFILDAYHYS